jgi:TAT (twin-arginine translocation) pathway signal sequence
MSDDYRFDELGKALAASTSRRKFLKVAAAAAAGAVLSVVGAPEAAARQCRDIGKNCRSNAECCTRFCGPNFTCGCPTGTELCGGQCIPNCTGGRVCNPLTGQCACPALQTGCNTAAGNICCPTGKCCGTGGTRVCCTNLQNCVMGVCRAIA